MVDIGWRPFVDSWASTREDANERQVLPSLFEKYIEATRTIVRKGFKEVTPLRVLNKVTPCDRNPCWLHAMAPKSLLLQAK